MDEKGFEEGIAG